MKNGRTYIRAGLLDRSHFQTSADQSRTKHLNNLMDEQEKEEQRFYDESTDKYFRANVFAHYKEQLSNIFLNGIAEINDDVRYLIDEYDLGGKDVWTYVATSLTDIDIETGREDNTYLIATENYGYLNIGLQYNMYNFTIEVGVTDTPDAQVYGGNPDLSEIMVSNFNVYDLCQLMSTVCYDLYGAIEEKEVYDMASDYLIYVLEDIISPAVTKGVDYCLKRNPPPLG